MPLFWILFYFTNYMILLGGDQNDFYASILAGSLLFNLLLKSFVYTTKILQRLNVSLSENPAYDTSLILYLSSPLDCFFRSSPWSTRSIVSTIPPAVLCKGFWCTDSPNEVDKYLLLLVWVPYFRQFLIIFIPQSSSLYKASVFVVKPGKRSWHSFKLEREISTTSSH